MISRPLLRLTLVAALSILTSVCSAAERPLKVGFIGGFSGPGAIYGIPCRRGFELALRQRDPQFTVYFEDDQFIPAKTVSAFRKLVDVEHVDVVVVLGSVLANVIVPLADKTQLVVFAWAGDSRVTRSHPNVFQTWVSGEESGSYLAREVAGRGITRVALLRIEDDHPQSVWNGFRSSFPGEIAEDIVIPPTETDLRSAATRIAAQHVTDVGICLGPGQSALFARRARELGASLSLFGCETLDIRSEVEGKPDLEGAWFTSIAVEPTFRELYVKTFGDDSMIGGAAVHFDLANILQAAASSRRPGEPLKEAVLRQDGHKGALGKLPISCGDRGCRFQVPMGLRRVEKGRIANEM